MTAGFVLFLFFQTPLGLPIGVTTATFEDARACQAAFRELQATSGLRVSGLCLSTREGTQP